MSKKGEELTRAIPFIQYLRLHGFATDVSIDRPEAVAAKADAIMEAGFRFECELLTTGDASFTISDDDGDYAVEVVKNGPLVLAAVDRLIMGLDLAEVKP